MIGGLYAANPDIKKVERIFNSLDYRKLFKLLVGRPMKSGLINGEKYRKFVEDCCAVKNIEETKIPFKAVSCDLVSGEKYVFETGRLPQLFGLQVRFQQFLRRLNMRGKFLSMVEQSHLWQ